MASVRDALVRALGTAELYGLTVQGIGADDDGDAYLYCWDTSPDVLAAALADDWQLIREDSLLTWQRGSFGARLTITCRSAGHPDRPLLPVERAARDDDPGE